MSYDLAFSLSLFSHLFLSLWLSVKYFCVSQMDIELTHTHSGIFSLHYILGGISHLCPLIAALPDSPTPFVCVQAWG